MDTNKAATKIVSYGEMIGFFLPIAASMMIMMSSHSIISSALARTADAAIAIAAYSVARSIGNMFHSPCITLRRASIALLKSEESYNKVIKLATITFIVALFLMGLVAFTPLNRVVFVNLIGISDELLPHTVRAFTILLVMPFLAAVRSIYQAYITLSRKTYLLTITTIVRIVVMFLLATVITNTKVVTGSIIGSILITAGIGTEAVFAFIFGRKLKSNLPRQTEEKEISFSGMWLFFLPLVVAQFAMTWGQPSVNAGLARTISPEVSMAAYQVGRSFAWIFIGMFGRVHQLVLVFANSKVNWQRVQKFAWILGISQTVFMLLLTLTPLGEWVLLNIIGVDQELMRMALSTIFAMGFIPVVISQTEVYAGLLIKKNRTPIITLSKFINVGAVIATVFIMLAVAPQIGAAIGGWSSLVGYLVELGILYGFSRNGKISLSEEAKIQAA